MATPRQAEKIGAEKKKSHTGFAMHNTEALEKWIDAMDEELPPLKNFILPSGGLAASQLHVSRTVCRRAERNLVKLLDCEAIDASAYQYLNRMSDYLFTLARFCALKEDKVETIYQKAKAVPEEQDGPNVETKEE